MNSQPRRVLGWLLLTTWASLSQATADEWYGWQIAATDAAAGSLLAASSRDSRALNIAAASLYFGGGPTIHLLHGRGLVALESLGLRTLFPVAMGLVAGASNNGNFVANLGIGVVAGVIIVVAYDWFKLARVKDDSPETAPTMSPVFTWSTHF